MNPKGGGIDERLAALQEELAQALISAFCALEQVSRLYDLKNAAVGKVVQDMVATVQRFARETGESLALTAAGHSFFVNRRLIRLNVQSYRRAQQMSAVWTGLGVGELTFPASFSLPDAEEFVARFVAGLRDQAAAPALLDRAWGGVVARGPVKESGLDENRIDPRQAAMRTYAALVVLVREMLAAIKGGLRPNPLPIRRCLQSLVEQSRAQPDLLIAFSRQLAARRELAVHLSNVAFYALLIARRLELGRSDLVSLASAALFHDLPKVDLDDRAVVQPDRLPPEERERRSQLWLRAVRHLLEGGGLSDELLARLVVMYEAQLEFGRVDLYPPAEGLAGHSLFSMIIAVADAFDTAAQARLESQVSAPDLAMGELLEQAGRRLHAGLVRLFVETVGLYPIGTAVLLSTGELGLVSAIEEPSAAARPTLALVADLRQMKGGAPAAVSGTVGLAYDRERQVIASTDASRMGINPVKVYLPE